MITLSEAKAQLNIDASNTAHDTELGSYVDAVTAVVEYQTGEIVDQREVVEYHQVRSTRRLLLFAEPVQSVTSVATLDGETTWNTADILLNPKRGELIADSGPDFEGYLEVTVQAGYAAVPPNYNLAARIILQHLWRTQRGVTSGPFGDAPSFGEGGVGFAVPRRAEELLGSAAPGVA